MKRVGAVLAGLVCLASADVRADPNSPLIDGEYQVGTFGTLRLTSTQSKDRYAVKGAYVKGERCGFAQSELLLEGTLEGSVLIAGFTTCIEGAGCQSPAKLALMAVIGDGSLTGYITLPKGCQAPGLEQRVTMQLVPTALRPAAKAFMTLSPPNFERAVPLLKRLSELPDGRNDVEVLFQLGSALNGQKDFLAGRQAFERAVALPAFPSTRPDTRALVFYNLGCAESVLSEKEPGLATLAVEHLKLALTVSKGASPGMREELRNQIGSDSELDAIRSHPEFQKAFGTKKAPR